MKKIFLCLFLVVGCSNIEVYPVGHLRELSEADLARKSQASLRESGVREYHPSPNERNQYYSSHQDSIAYREYLLLECLILLHKEHHLDLNKAVYASHPKWNNVQNWYASVFNFYTLLEKATEETMECDLAVNDKNEVADYQLKKIYAKLNKN